MESEPAVIDQNRDLWLLGKPYENIALIHRWGKKRQTRCHQDNGGK